MPYLIEKRGNKWLLINKRTGKVKGTHATREEAESQERLLRAIEHGWKPTKRK